MRLQQEGRLFTDKMLLTLVIPLVLEQALSTLVGMIDGIMVSAVSEAGMSGVSLVNNISAVVLNLFGGLATGGAVLTSQYLGAQQKVNAKRSAGQMLLLATGVATLLGAVCFVFASSLLKLFFGAVEPDVMEAALIYFQINAISFPFLAIRNAGGAIMRCLGDSKISMRVTLLANIVNIIGNAVFIYGVNMGVAGVAVATLLARIVGAAVIMIPVVRPGHDLSLTLKEVIEIQKQMIGKIFGIAIPSAMENSMFSLGRLLTLSMFAGFGTAHTAANSVAGTLTNIIIVVRLGIGAAMLTVVGQCIGAREIEQAKYYTRKLLVWCYIGHGILTVLTLVFHMPLINCYENLSAETIELSKQLLFIFGIPGIFFYTPSFNLPQTLRAANDGRFTMMVSIGTMLLCRIGLSWVLCVQMQWGVIGVWVAMALDWVFRTIIFAWRYYSGAWKKKCYLA